MSTPGDPALGAAPPAEPGPAPLAPVRRPWPRLRLEVVAAVFLGGSLGGWARSAAGSAWPTAPGAFPTAVLAVNVAGAFVLAVLVVLAAELRPHRLARPLLGTGFCGGLTTFSAVVVDAGRLLGDGQAALAAACLAANAGGGLLAAALGLAVGRGLFRARRARARGGRG